MNNIFFLKLTIFLMSLMIFTIIFTSFFELNATATNKSLNTDVYDLPNSTKLNIPEDNTLFNIKPLKIFTSFYPVYDFVKKIGKDKIDISTIVPAGIEPHDFEPTAKQIIEIQNASAVFINGAGFESFLNKINNIPIIDLSVGLPLEKNNENYDPHIWLDPAMVKIQAKTIIDSLTNLDPQNKLSYRNNYIQFINELDQLNADITSNLTNCEFHEFLSFHDAFSYFATRYGLTQNTIQGLSPEADFPPQKIKEAIDLSKQLGIDVIFAEDHIDPRLSELIAKEINGQVLILSPIEILSDEEKQMNKDYFSKMYDNLNNLKIALKCTS